MIFNGRAESRVIREGRMEFVGQIVNVISQLLQTFSNRAEQLCELFRRKGRLLFEGGYVENQRGYPLAEIVVQFAGDTASLLLLRGDEFGCQIFQVHPLLPERLLVTL